MENRYLHRYVRPRTISILSNSGFLLSVASISNELNFYSTASDCLVGKQFFLNASYPNWVHLEHFRIRKAIYFGRDYYIIEKYRWPRNNDFKAVGLRWGWVLGTDQRSID